MLSELVRTPAYHSCQGGHWLVCCERPMIFTGLVRRTQLSQRAKKHTQAVEARAAQIIEGAPPDLASFLDGIEAGKICTYGFRCPSCDRVRAHWDVD